MVNINAVFALTAMQLNDKLKVFKNRNIVFSILFYLLLGIALCGLGIVFYIIFTSVKLAGLLDMSIGLFSVISGVLGFIIILNASFAIIKDFYLSKHNDFYAKLPSSGVQLFLSKLITLYVRQLVATIFLVLPFFIWFGLFSTQSGNNINAIYYVNIGLFVLLIPAYAMMVASLISVPIMVYCKYIKNKRVLLGISLAVVFALILVAYFYLLSGIGSYIDIGNSILPSMLRINARIAQLSKLFFINRFMARTILVNNVQFFYLGLPLALVVIGALCALTMLLVKPYYFNLMREMSLNKVVVNKKQVVYKSSSVLSSLFKRELLAILRSKDIILSFFIFSIFMPFFMYGYDKMFFALDINKRGIDLISGAHLFAMLIFVTLSNCYSSCSIKSHDLVAIKTQPVSINQSIISKMLANGLITIICIIVSSVVCIIGYVATTQYIDTSMIVGFIFSLITCIIFLVGTILFFMSLQLGSVKKINKNSNKNVSTAILVGLVVSSFIGILHMALVFDYGLYVVWGMVLLIAFGLMLVALAFYVFNLRKFNKIEV